ncbi:MAG TPA: aspartate kinase [Perlabentimonas sp.]|nr:aspartate kinase [Bacteroidales bacterium]MDD4673812.1 aspartate kinase [Bacteroidales bacterium]MDY0348958.1 aspartate kinase [Tenuifilaceae bacterium]HZJ73343.1 aspartate kinase [Perlabentimonas sp.]
MLSILKFGGASVKNAEGVENLWRIVKTQRGSLVVVASAMGKTTNALEVILSNFLDGDSSMWSNFEKLKSYHLEIAHQLFKTVCPQKIADIEAVFNDLLNTLRAKPSGSYNFYYDQIIPFGEILSTKIIAIYLNAVGVTNQWVDIRKVLRTDCNFREGNVDYSASEILCRETFQHTDNTIFVTQGFIGGTADGFTTTLGREGSDYSAALLANLLNASSVTIWKDVDGVLNADPRIFPSTIKLDEISFKEAIELAYCGAQIIHPKTIKPLQNKDIPLFVKSFANPTAQGTRVFQTEESIPYPPIFVLKPNQVLISLTPRDYSFVIEDCLSKIFAILYKHRVKANIVQSSAISFTISVDSEVHFLPNAIDELNHSFDVKYNKNMELLTIRHYDEGEFARLMKGKTIFLQQKTRSTIRVVYENETQS